MKFSTPITISDVTGKQWSFDTVKPFESFIKSQSDFWSQRASLGGSNPTANHYIQKYSSFQSILNQIVAWKPQIETWDSNSLYGNFVNLVSPSNLSAWLWSGHPFVEKWLELNQTSPNIADAFFEAILQKSAQRVTSHESFQGYLIAYEYINQGKTEIGKRRNSEEKSLSNLRDQLEEKNNELIEEVDEFQTEMSAWKSETEDSFSKWFENQKTHLESTLLAHSRSFHNQFDSWINKHLELENRFREELRFESPASYWGTKVGSFKKQGYWWGAGLISSLVIGIWIFSKYFLAWLNGQPSGLGLQSIEGILIFASIISSFAFLVRSLSKMTFSSFHLMRDAEEREQLTHLYLSLRDGKEDDPESRKIVLQALFSRSDSGLLAGDHSPTMPTVQDALKIIKPSN